MGIIYGFIGCGNMGGALAQAAARAVPAGEIALSDARVDHARQFSAGLGARCETAQSIAREGRYVFLGVKPQVLPELLAELAPIFNGRQDRFTLISMVAGVSIAAIQAMLGKDFPVIRIMPNTPASEGKGLILFAPSAAVTQEELGAFMHVMSEAGVLDQLSESLIDAGCALSGCGPAFVYMFIEAMADGAVKCGLPRDKALLYAEQTVLGAAALALKSGMHPGALKDAVCSPGGSTIAGVYSLEKSAFRGAVMSAVTSAFEKTGELG